MSDRTIAIVQRALGSLLLLFAVVSSTGCRAMRAQKLDERLDRLENRVTALEVKLEARQTGN